MPFWVWITAAFAFSINKLFEYFIQLWQKIFASCQKTQFWFKQSIYAVDLRLWILSQYKRRLIWVQRDISSPEKTFMQIILKTIQYDTYYSVLCLTVHSEITLIGKYIQNYLPGYCNMEQNNENTYINTRFSVLSCVQPHRICIDHSFILHFDMFSSKH